MSRRLPSLKARDVIRALEGAGFALARTTGSHHILVHPDRPGRFVTVSVHQGVDLPRGTLRAIIKQAGLTVEEFIGLL